MDRNSSLGRRSLAVLLAVSDATLILLPVNFCFDESLGGSAIAWDGSAMFVCGSETVQYISIDEF